jgi:ech hydrogenase subunit E
MLDKVEKDLNDSIPVILDDYTVRMRTVGKGVVSKENAIRYGMAGPSLRASGVVQDMRSSGYAAYNELGFEPIVETAGDSFARAVVRAREARQCIELVRRALNALPSGDICVKRKAMPKGRSVTRVEAPRGELLYFIVGNGTKNLERVRIRVPTFANIPALLAMLPGADFADVPVITLSIDPCVSCTER